MLNGVRYFPFPEMAAFGAFEELAHEALLRTGHGSRQFCLITAFGTRRTISDGTIWHIGVLQGAGAQPAFSITDKSRYPGCDQTMRQNRKAREKYILPLNRNLSGTAQSTANANFVHLPVDRKNNSMSLACDCSVYDAIRSRSDQRLI